MNAIAQPFYAAHSLHNIYLSRLSAAELSGAITVQETVWLKTAIVDDPGQSAYSLRVTRHGSRPIHLIGAFILRKPSGPQVFLFTAWGRFERFDDEEALRYFLEQQLDDPFSRVQWLHFVSPNARPAMAVAGELRLMTQRYSSSPVIESSRLIHDFLLQSQEETLASILAVPTLRSCIDAQLKIHLAQAFQGQALDAHNVRVRSYKPAANSHEMIESVTSLSSLALEFIVKGQLPPDYQHTFYGPFIRQETDDNEALRYRFTRVLSTVTGQFPAQMNETLADYWRDAQPPGLSPHDYCVARLRGIFFQAMVQARLEGELGAEQFSDLQRLVSATSTSSQVQAVRLQVFQPDAGEVLLCALLYIYFPGQDREGFLFGAPIGLKKIMSRARLKDYVLAPLRNPATFEVIARHAALDQRALLAGMSEPRLSIENVQGDIFVQCVLDIRLKQARDFSYMYNQYLARRDVLAALDHALDVRELIDHGLLLLNSRGRWNSRFVPGSNGLPLSPYTNGLSELLSLKLLSVEAQRNALLMRWPTAHSYAHNQLSIALNREGRRFINVAQMRVQIFDTDQHSIVREPNRTLTLVDALLERVTTSKPLVDNPALIETGFESALSDEIKPLKTLGGTKLLTLLDQLAVDFFSGFKQQVSLFFYGDVSIRTNESLANHLTTLRQVMLRADMRLTFRGNHLDVSDKAVITTVLTYPHSQRRPAINHFIPDVYGVFLSLGPSLSAVCVNHCLLITQRGGLESANAGRAILWTPVSGFERFESLDDCTAQLEARLMSKTLRWDFLVNVSCEDQLLVSAYLDARHDWAQAGQNQWFYFDRFEQDFVYQCQTAAINTVLLDVDYICAQARAINLSAAGFENSVRTLLVERHAGINFARQREASDTQQFEAALPVWLKSASRADQLTYANLLQRYQMAVQDNGSYLHGISDITDYARAQLRARLASDFPAYELQPDAIEVVIDTYVAAPVALGNTPSFLPAATSRKVQTLTQFALNSFYRIEGGSIFLRPTTNTALPVALDVRYIRALVRKLDIGRNYRLLLTTHLAPGNEGVEARQRQFTEQLTLQLLEQGLREKLEGSLTATVFGYLKHLLNRPDGLARDPVNGVSIIIRPLELIADSGRDPDLATGIYVIGPEEREVGPHLLWVMYNERFTLKEYPSEAQLLADLQNNEALQALVLQRLPEFERKTYANGGFVEPHLPHYVNSTLLDLPQIPVPVALACRPIRGNLFLALYKDNYQLLLEMAASQSKTTAESDWESFKYLLSLLANTAIMFVPGKLSIPFVVWQSLALASEGQASAKKGHWVESVWQFSMALLMLATNLQSRFALSENGFASAPSSVTHPLSDLQLQEHQEALAPFQANDVSLVDLVQDPETRIYSDSRTQLKYVQLGAQVFRIQAWRNRWRIFLDEHRDGPLITLDDHQQWQVDINEPLLGGGPVHSAIGSYGTLVSNSLTYEIKAIGMDSIERRFPERALMIREAHAWAIGYLERATQALHALDEPGAKNQQTRQLLNTFFNVVQFDAAMRSTLTEQMDAMLARFLHPDLSPVTSSKYVLCRSRFSSQAAAFINRWDTSKRIYLTDIFFKTLFERDYAVSHPYMHQTNPPFPVNRQLRASFLLHEMTHQVLNTEDVHYLNPGFPYLDLMDTRLPFGRYLKFLIETVQRCHSPRVPRANLFQQLDPDTLLWTDLPSGPAKAKVKTIAGVNTLEEARTVFTDNPGKRVELMLANADTLVMLMMLLGRIQPVLPQMAP